MVVNESEALRWVARQLQRLSRKDEVSAECCESFVRMNVRRETIPSENLEH